MKRRFVVCKLPRAGLVLNLSESRIEVTRTPTYGGTMNQKRTLFLALLTGVVMLSLLTSVGLLASGSQRVQLNPTEQQQTIDAVVQQRIQQTAQAQQQRIQQTAQAQQQIALTRTVEAAFSRALTATAGFEATVNAQINTALTATQQAGIQATQQALMSVAVAQEFDGVTMVLVPAGCFMMGTPDDEIARLNTEYGTDQFLNESPQHEVCFDQPFWIDQTEVTQADFERLGGVKANANYFDGDQRPVEQITWFEARDFCALRGARLPTESEWEYAARGPDNRVYPWGNTWKENNTVWSGNSDGQTAPVGNLIAGASWVGALDMSGNVWEWVSSLVLPYDSTEDREAETGNRTYVLRVLRGGSWNDGGTDSLRAGNRVRLNPVSRYLSVGFRCARSS